jgi:diguanylate cyclase (GGDEF)-like protein
MKLKNSILSLLLIFTLFPVGIFGIFSIYATNRKIDEMAEQNLEAVSGNQIMNIQNFCDERKDEMQMIGSYSLTQDAILASLGKIDVEVNRDYVDNLLRERKKYVSFVASISILDRNFRVVGSSEHYEISEISTLKYIGAQYHTGEFVIGNTYERRTDDGLKKVVPAYVGAYYNNELIGYIAEELDTAYFNDLRLNMDSLAEGTFYLLDGKGAIITAGDTKQKNSIDNFVTKHSDRNDFQEKWDAIDHTANPSGKIHYHYQGMDYVTYYSNVENTDWGIRISENLTAQRETSKTYTVLILLSLGFITVGVLFTQNFVTKKILSPINAIMQTFARIRKTQDYSIRIPICTTDEMGQLAGGINKLLSFIEEEDMQEKARQRHLREMAECDPLTGIKNKKAIEQKMLELVQEASEKENQITVGFLDIDDFRNYNTNWGHAEGDSVIKFVADVLKKEFPGEVGRNGGDEFVFCLLGTITPERIREIASHILEQLNNAYTSDRTKETMPIPCSIGIVTAKSSNLSYADLIQWADEAMYKAKDAGKNTFHLIEYQADQDSSK